MNTMKTKAPGRFICGCGFGPCPTHGQPPPKLERGTATPLRPLPATPKPGEPKIPALGVEPGFCYPQAPKAPGGDR